MAVVLEQGGVKKSLGSPTGKASGSREERTREQGRRLLAELRRQERRTGADWLYNRLIGLTTAAGALEIERCRFVEALPAVKTPEAVAQHLEEYLGRPGVKLPPGAMGLLRLLRRTALTERLLAGAARRGAQMMARRFIAGANAREATGAVERLRRRNMTFTLELLELGCTSSRYYVHRTMMTRVQQ